MKLKPILCLTLATSLLLGGASAIATSQYDVKADGLKLPLNGFSDRFSVDKTSVDFSAIEKPIDSSQDSSDLKIEIGEWIPIRPPILDSEEDEDEEELPSHYSMRDDYVMYAQHQDKEGYCWNFAATMSASTTLMRATGEYYDFSESWNGLASFFANGTGYDKIGSGGTFSYQRKAIQQSGLMLETDLPYQYTYTMSSENAEDYYNFFKQYSNDDLVDCLKSTSFSKKDINAIKKHVYNEGSVYAAFSFRQSHKPDENGIYAIAPNQKNTTSSHAVSIIGWDDNYEREFILDGTDTPTVFKGAWLVLNSFMESNGQDGVFFVFYDDNNLYSPTAYSYAQPTDKDLYFYDKIEEGYAYPNTVKGKYCGDFTAQEGVTKQKNIFYDDVNLEYSYLISEGASIENISIYLDNIDVTKQFEVRIDEENKRFYIAKNNAQYGQYKVLVTYGNGQKSDTYLNNFFVTHGLLGEKLEFNTEENNLAFNTGRDLEYYSIIRANKDYVIYTNQRSGSLNFLPIHQSIYSDKNMSIPSLSYEIAEGNSGIVTHTITSNTGYALNYNFHLEYYEDTTLQPVTMYYDVGGGINHPKNYQKELANATTDLVLYAPTREGYVFDGWYLNHNGRIDKLTKKGDMYYLEWNKIHHMGESPTLHASSYYTQYYNNTNIAFVYASWIKEESQSFDVHLSVQGQGNATCNQLLNGVSFGESRVVELTAEAGWEIAGVYVNGEQVSVVNNQIVLDNITKDTEILVVYAKSESHAGYIIAIGITSFVALLSVSLLVVDYIKIRKRKKLGESDSPNPFL